MTNDDETLILSVNGEIYNHKALRKMCAEGTNFKTQSDCEVILHLVRFFLSLLELSGLDPLSSLCKNVHLCFLTRTRRGG